MSYDLGTAHGKITLDYDGHGAADRASKDIDKLSKDSDKSSSSIKKLGGILGGLWKVAKPGLLAGLFSEAAVGAANLGIQILGIIPQLTSMLSLAAALPGAFTGMVVSIGVLKTAFNGVGEAIKLAFDPKKAAQFNRKLKDLSPSAAAFVSEIHKAAPALQAYGKGIQEAFFQSSGLAGMFPRLITILRSFRGDLQGLASDFGATTRDVLNFATGGKSVSFVAEAVRALRGDLGLVTPSIVPILDGLVEVGKVGLPILNRFSAAVSGVATQFADWLHSIAQSGQLQTWIDTAIQTLNTLGNLIKNIGSIFTSVVTAAASTGGGLLNTLASLTGQAAAFLKSTDGMQSLQTIFAAIASVAKPIGPILTTAASAIAKALGPAIIQLTSVLGPALLDVVQRLAPALGPVAEALAGLLIAITPLLAPAAQLISLLGQFAAVLVNGVVAELGPLVNVLSQGLLAAFTALMPAVQAFSQILPIIADAGAQLGQAFAPLVPAITQVATALAGALVQNMPQLVDALKGFIPVAIQFAQVVANNMSKQLIELAPLIPPLVDGFTKLIIISGKVMETYLRVYTAVNKVGGVFASLPGRVIGAVKSVGSAIGSAFGSIGSVLEPVSGLFTNLPAKIGGALSSLGSMIGSAFSTALSALQTAGGAIVSFFTALPGRLLAALQALPGLLLGAIKTALTGLVTAVAFSIGLVVGIFTKLPGDIVRAVQRLAPIVGGALKSAWDSAYAATVNGIQAVVSFATSLPGRIRAAIAAAISFIGNALRAGWNAAYAATVNGIASAVNFARSLPGRMRSAISALGGYLRSTASSALNSMRNAIVSGVNSAVSFFRSLPGRMRSALGNLGSLLYNSGRAIIDGLMNGLRAAAGRVLSFLGGLADKAKNAFNSALSIFSPSREFKWSGEMIGEGLIKGLLAKMVDVGRTAKALAQTVIQPTLDLPTAVTMAVNAIPALPAARAQIGADAGRPDFGPYELKVDQGTLAKFTIDAVTGNPKPVAKAADEGKRQNQFAGSGRKSS